MAPQLRSTPLPFSTPPEATLAACVMGALWATASAVRWSLRTLGLLDAGSLLLAGIGLALMAAQPEEKQLNHSAWTAVRCPEGYEPFRARLGSSARSVHALTIITGHF